MVACDAMAVAKDGRVPVPPEFMSGQKQDTARGHMTKCGEREWGRTLRGGLSTRQLREVGVEGHARAKGESISASSWTRLSDMA
jgi:hypothetical protein